MKQLITAIAFAADKHRNQRRKDPEGSPYINHPIALANLLLNEAGIEDQRVLVAAVLHDTIEDTKTTEQELVRHFGKEVADIVLEVTDDKALPKAERKRLQVAHAPHLAAAPGWSNWPTKSATCATSPRRRRRTGRLSANGSISTGPRQWSMDCAACIPASNICSTGPTKHGRKGRTADRQLWHAAAVDPPKREVARFASGMKRKATGGDFYVKIFG